MTSRVLVVDDDPATVAWLSEALTDASWSLSSASTLAEARQVLADRHVDVIVLDKHLPDGDGTTLVSDLQRHPATSVIRVIMISVDDTPQARLAGLEAGAIDFLSKSVLAEELRARVRSHVSRASMARGLMLRRMVDQDFLVDATSALARVATATDAERTLTSRAVTLSGCDFAFVVPLVGPGRGTVTASSGGALGQTLRTGTAIPEETMVRIGQLTAGGGWLDPGSERLLTPLLEHAPPAMSVIALPSSDGPIGILAVASATPISGSSRVGGVLTGLARAAGGVIAHLNAEERRTRQDAQALDGALRGEGLSPVFHAIARVDTGQVIGFEALTRFADGAPPEPRFQSATAMGRGVELELAAVRGQLRAAESLPADVWVALNVSPAVLSDRRLGEALLRTERPVVLEITEHDPIDDYDEIHRALRRLPGQPMLAIDDAGSGYACLAHILALKPDYIKLDRVWVRGLHGDLARQALIAGVRHFADELGAEVIAEGVEQPEELKALASLDVKLVQGNLFGRPDVASRLERVIHLA